MTDISDYLEDKFGDARAVSRRVTDLMRDLGLSDAVVAHWGEASSPVCVVRADGSMYTTGRQSADYSCRCWAARDGEETNGAVSLWWDGGGWRVSVENDETEVVVHPSEDDDEEEEEFDAA